MQTTGAAWEMTSLTQEPIFVALLAAAGTLPMFLFCFFAGILADRFVSTAAATSSAARSG